MQCLLTPELGPALVSSLDLRDLVVLYQVSRSDRRYLNTYHSNGYKSFKSMVFETFLSEDCELHTWSDYKWMRPRTIDEHLPSTDTDEHHADIFRLLRMGSYEVLLTIVDFGFVFLEGMFRMFSKYLESIRTFDKFRELVAYCIDRKYSCFVLILMEYLFRGRDDEDYYTNEYSHVRNAMYNERIEVMSIVDEVIRSGKTGNDAVIELENFFTSRLLQEDLSQ